MKLLNYLTRAASIAKHPANRANVPGALWRIARFRYGVAVQRPVDLSLLGGKRVRCYPDSNIARSLAYYGAAPDHAPMTFMAQYLRPGDAVLDVGANIGIYSLVAASFVEPNGAVHAFEPVPSTLARLEENLALNGVDVATIHRCAVGKEDGVVSMTTALDGTNHLDEAGGDLQVPLRRLDDIFPDTPFAFAKFDIEGAEWPALEGASKMLARGVPPVFVFELNGALERFGHQPKAFVDWIEDRGYIVGTYDPRTVTFRRDPSAWDDVFAIHKDRVPDLSARIAGFKWVT